MLSAIETRCLSPSRDRAQRPESADCTDRVRILSGGGDIEWPIFYAADGRPGSCATGIVVYQKLLGEKTVSVASVSAETYCGRMVKAIRILIVLRISGTLDAGRVLS